MNCFSFLATINNMATEILQRYYVDISFYSLGYILRSGIPGSYGNSIFNFLKKCQNIFPKRLHCFKFQLIWKLVFLNIITIFLHLNLSKALTFHVKGKDIPQSVPGISSFITMFSNNSNSLPFLALLSGCPIFLLPSSYPTHMLTWYEEKGRENILTSFSNSLTWKLKRCLLVL